MEGLSVKETPGAVWSRDVVCGVYSILPCGFTLCEDEEGEIAGLTLRDDPKPPNQLFFRFLDGAALDDGFCRDQWGRRVQILAQ